jgi:hypothetical protein
MSKKIYKEFSIGTYEKIIEEEIDEVNEEAAVKIIADMNVRNKIRELILEGERKELSMNERDRQRNQNSTPEDFIIYIMLHNLWITKENFHGNFEKMQRFKSSTN